MNFGSWFVVQSNFLSFITIIMAPRKRKVEDITTVLNFSAAIREQEPDWDAEKVQSAAKYCRTFMAKRLNPYSIKEKLKEWDAEGNGILY